MLTVGGAREPGASLVTLTLIRIFQKGRDPGHRENGQTGWSLEQAEAQRQDGTCWSCSLSPVVPGDTHQDPSSSRLKLWALAYFDSFQSLWTPTLSCGMSCPHGWRAGKTGSCGACPTLRVNTAVNAYMTTGQEGSTDR